MTSSTSVVGVTTAIGGCALVSVGMQNALKVTRRYSVDLEPFLEQQGVSQPHAVARTLQTTGLSKYSHLHAHFIWRRHEWLGEIPAPNQATLVRHLNDTSRHLFASPCLPCGMALLALRDTLVRSIPIVELDGSRLADALKKMDPSHFLDLGILVGCAVLLWRYGGQMIRKRCFKAETPDITFEEVIGMKAAKSQVEMYVNFLQTPHRFTRLGARMPKGCLLAGPPGTGKTYLAKAVAGTAGVPFFAASGSDFMELFVGQGARSVRELFAAARKAAPSVVFIDELDAVGSHRSSADTTGEHTRTINQLLAEMDGMVESDVVVFAATNRIDQLDSAILRPGRFDKLIHMDIPDAQTRAQLFEFYLERLAVVDPATRQNTPLAQMEAVKRQRLAAELAQQTPGLTPAHVSAICNEAALLAAMEDACFVDKKHLERAASEAVSGVRETRLK
eukprot:NODE_1710_length_1406_cov_14.907740_g1624_i0.p1 GENE.NODE_1710_length_1406_cov_14.907740_g1624_i0~~NODE_1710_length_1406_cov_14.907740_g1624_i0.p1  ORF type:complete len:448 (-),score=81.75 NODE_1710_length_1406_cov_14.907740_g1624_i0:61-1404(-)